MSHERNGFYEGKIGNVFAEFEEDNYPNTERVHSML